MSRTPGEMLESFENRHGEHYDLLHQLADAQCSRNPDQKEIRRLNGLLQRHRELVWMDMGYQRALKDMEKKG